MMRIGTGYDVHRLEEGRKLILGGVEIPFEKGLLGHSDADVLLHAVSDSLLGAAALGDIGGMFPDDDPENQPRLTWRGHANLLYRNWINWVYQMTPYEFERIPEVIAEMHEQFIEKF